jgi:HK97 family phage major capsid protein
MWSIPVVLSPSLAAGTFLVGAFQQGPIIFEREMLTVVVAYQNEDDFVRNLATIRGEERCALAVPLPAALITGSFTPGVTRR